MITAAIVGKNNSDYIERCLNSVSKFVDEILYLDTGSEDHTVEVAKRYKAKIFHTEQKTDYARDRNFLIEKASNDWILSIDTDEVATDYMANNCKEYLETLPKQVSHIYFKMAHLIYDEQHMTDSPLFKHYLAHPRLYKKEGTRWFKPTHEILKNNGSPAKWDIFALVHYNLLLTDRLQKKSPPKYRNREKYSTSDIVELWRNNLEVIQVPQQVKWVH